MNVTQRLAMPMLFSGQAAKETTVNEALQALDAVVAAAVEGEAINTPPASPVAGSCYLIGGSPAGEWTGKAGHLAAYTANGWRFIAPVEGLTAMIKSSGLTTVFRDGGWQTGLIHGTSFRVGGLQVVGERAAAIANPTGGSVIDGEARSAIGAILGALRAHGLIAS